MTVDSTPPDSADLEFDLSEVASLPAVAVENPLRRCLSHGSTLAKSEASPLTSIPPAPRLPQFERQLAASTGEPNETAPADLEETLRPAAPRADANTPLKDPDPRVAQDRVLPGSPALVSTFRPKPIVRVCYSVTQSLATERVYRSRRPPPRVGNKK